VQFGDTLGTAPVTLKNAFGYEDPTVDTVRVLLPIAAGTQGILSTSWQTDVLAHNDTTAAVSIAGTSIPATATRRLTLAPTSIGMFLQVPRSVVDGVTITTHVHDTTHDAENLGVDVPSIPETQFRRSIVLPGVPNDARYRTLLRVYGYPGNYPVAVSVFDDSTGEILSRPEFTLSGSDIAYLQMPITAPAASRVLRVEVTTDRPSDPPIWAFLTLTNNTTENVTTITPSLVVAPSSPVAVLAVGRWAHNGYCMTVSPLGDAGVTVAGGCGGGGSFPPPYVDGNGRFEVDGSFVFGSGACCPSPEPAHYSGVVTNGTLALTIQTKTQTVGPFTLIYASAEPCFMGSCP
jgi:hypothetical protein